MATDSKPIITDTKLSLTAGKLILAATSSGKRLERVVDLTEVSSLLTDAARIESGILPPNTRLCRMTDTGAVLAVEVPVAKYRVSIKHDSYYMSREQMFVDEVPLPAALFIFRASKNRDGGYNLNSGSIYALKSRLKTEQDELFLYPAPNVQPGQTICWGFDQYSANRHTYRSFAGFEGAVRLFFSAAFNDHCFEKSRLSQTFDWSKIPDYRAVEKYFDWLRVCGRFEDSWLVPANKKFADVIS